MRIKFCGATGCVTGSSHLLSINGRNVLLDCGLFQGKDEKERGNESFDFDPKEIDYVILSHSHIDHSGRIPLLYRQGFKGRVICTEATKDLCSVMLPDSGHIQEMDVEWKNRKRIRQGLDTIEPLYTAKDAEASMCLFDGYSYDKYIDLFEGLKICFRDAGHLLGSAITELFIKEPHKEEVKVVYTGDLGNLNIPIIKDPSKIDYADYVIMETTYGDRLHENIESQFMQLADIVKETFKRGGNVIIPSFSVGRTQELLYRINRYIEDKIFDSITVYVDSPLAEESTKIFEKYGNYYDEEASEILSSGEDLLDFKGLIFTKSPEESAKINKIKSGIIIISASGMCDAGRIKHHLKHNLWRKECSIVFSGYQAEGTTGRLILDGAKKVKLFGEDIAVKAHIYNLQGLSGHADRNGLLNWVKSFKKKPENIFLVHGDQKAQMSFKELLEFNQYRCQVVQRDETISINDDKFYQNDNLSIKDKLIELLSSGKLDGLNKEQIIEKIKSAL